MSSCDGRYRLFDALAFHPADSMEQSILMADEAKAARAAARQFLALCRCEGVCKTLQDALMQVQV